MTQFVGLVRVQHLAGIAVENHIRIARGVALLMIVLAMPLVDAMGVVLRTAGGGRLDGNRCGQNTHGTGAYTRSFVPARIITYQLQSPVSSSQKAFPAETPARGEANAVDRFFSLLQFIAAENGRYRGMVNATLPQPCK
jgi:hypothetical protein